MTDFGIESVQIYIENVTRLTEDSSKVSTPTRFALLELALEELAKAWAILFSIEIKTFEENEDFEKEYIKINYIDKNAFDRALDERLKFLDISQSKIFDGSLSDINSVNFTKHQVKIEYIGDLIKLLREILLPVSRYSLDRVKLASDILGKYIAPMDSSTVANADVLVVSILSIKTDHLIEILRIKNSSLYVDAIGNHLISPSARNYEIKTLENLVLLLTVLIKNELILFSKTMSQYNKKKLTFEIRNRIAIYLKQIIFSLLSKIMSRFNRFII